MDDDPSCRARRIEQLLLALRDEVIQGIERREIGDYVDFSFVVPTSSTFDKGAVMCVFRARPTSEYIRTLEGLDQQPKVSAAPAE